MLLQSIEQVFFFHRNHYYFCIAINGLLFSNIRYFIFIQFLNIGLQKLSEFDNSKINHFYKIYKTVFHLFCVNFAKRILPILGVSSPTSCPVLLVFLFITTDTDQCDCVPWLRP